MIIDDKAETSLVILDKNTAVNNVNFKTILFDIN
jgi:hypothetical protein